MNPNEPDASEVPPVAPAFLSARERKYFREVTARMAEIGLASRTYEATIALLAQRLAEIEEIAKLIKAMGRAYETTATSGDVLMRSNPLVGQRNEAMRHAQSLLAELAITPVSKSKGSAAKPRGAEGADPWAALS